MINNFFQVENFDYDVIMIQPDGETKMKLYRASSKLGAIHKAQEEFPQNTVYVAYKIR